MLQQYYFLSGIIIWSYLEEFFMNTVHIYVKAAYMIFKVKTNSSFFAWKIYWWFKVKNSKLSLCFLYWEQYRAVHSNKKKVNN